jgi:predicted RNA-binding Zn-ribbon protein involved in translation (DUF1610 family)
MHDDDAHDLDNEMIENDPGMTCECTSCGKASRCPTFRISGDFVSCEHCGNDVHTGKEFEAWANTGYELFHASLPENTECPTCGYYWQKDHRTRSSHTKIDEPVATPHAHYFKNVSHLHHIDIYRLLELYEVTCPVAQHIVKKALAAGKRGAKNQGRDMQDILDSANRWQQMRKEDASADL